MIKRYVMRTWWRYLLGSVGLLASTALDIWFPIITMNIVDEVIVGGEYDKLWPNLLCILAAGVGRMLFQYLKEFLYDMGGCHVADNVRRDLMGHFYKMSRSFFKRNNTGELMARVKDDASKIWDITGFAGMLIIEASCYLVGVIVCMLLLDFRLALVPIAFLPVLGVMVMKLEKKLDVVYGEISEENAALTRVIEENISGVRTVKAFCAENFEIEKFDKRNELYNELNIRQARYMAVAEPVINFIPKIMQACVLLVGGIMAINHGISYGLLVAFMQYASNIVWPIENMGWLLNTLSSAIASHRKIMKIFAEKPDIEEKEDAVSLEDKRCSLEFKNVSFTLEDTQILKDVSFEIENGKTLGIMGSTGTGKSMIVNLIERFHDVSEGAILIGGIDIRDLTLKSVRDYSSVVTQDIFLFSDTIKENVKLGRKQTLSDSAVNYALDKAHASEFVKKITGGYDAVIGERGIGLSGGQKQRLSIARALSKEAGLLIMDDSTSALDMETEADIQKEIAAKKDMSKIIIGHRISSVKDADEIIVLSDGQIAERGTHEELLVKKGLYYSTYEAQYGNYKEALKVMEGGGESWQ